MSTTDSPKYTKKDFASDQEVRWCPGCGDYAILNSVQTAFASLGIAREDFVIVSGIGCAARFPYYMETYGFHTVHGRAPSFATGVKLSQPDKSVWVVTGDGDALAIGGNHLMHALRRNVGINILLFNNQIYGLTKGQYSPTSERGKKTVSTPMGSLDRPYNPLSVVLGANATFVARTVDRFAVHLQDVLKKAAAHEGTSFVEIYQNCNIFNDGAFLNVTDKQGRIDNALYLEHGKPMLFGADDKYGLQRDADGRLMVVEVAQVGLDNVAKHDVGGCPSHAFALAQLQPPHHPVPLGIVRDVEAPVFEQAHDAQVAQARAQRSGDLQDLVRGSDTWEVT